MLAVSLGEFLTNKMHELWLRLGEHIVLVSISVFAAICIGVPLAMLAFRRRWTETPVLTIVGALQTMPSIAMLSILLALTGKTKDIPALIALTLYALLPIVRNTLAGLQGVRADVIEAARGVGMTPRQSLWMVRVPLAMPVIVAGIKTAAVVAVGIATLSAFIGAGGLGKFINAGLVMGNNRLIWLGAVPAIILAFVVSGAIGAAEQALAPGRRRRTRSVAGTAARHLAISLPLLLVVFGVVATVWNPFPKRRRAVEVTYRIGTPGTIRIATKNFTEQLIIGEMMAQLLEARTRLTVTRDFNLAGTMICHEALVHGEMDLYPEYTGTALTAILKQEVIADPQKAYDAVAEAYLEKYDLVWLEPFGFNNTYAITVRASDADEHGWTTISDLKDDAAGLRAGFTAEFSERPDGYPGLQAVYDIDFGSVDDFDPQLMYDAIAHNEVDVICAFATDGRIAAYSLKPLKDNYGFFPPYYAAPVVRAEFLDEHPEVRHVLAALAGRLDDATMQRLNYKVDENRRDPADVAYEFLVDEGLLKGD
jgi:osmoprotectant transport system permease protein